MANVAVFRAGQMPVYLRSVETSLYVNDTDALINPNVTAVLSVPLKYWKRVGSLVQEMTAGEKTAVDAALAAALTTANRTEADTVTNQLSGAGVELRAIVGVLIDELNVLRGWTVSFKAEVAAATNLADLKTRVATLPTLNDRTLAQAKTAYQNKISSGGAD